MTDQLANRLLPSVYSTSASGCDWHGNTEIPDVARFIAASSRTSAEKFVNVVEGVEEDWRGIHETRPSESSQSP